MLLLSQFSRYNWWQQSSLKKKGKTIMYLKLEESFPPMIFGCKSFSMDGWRITLLSIKTFIIILIFVTGNIGINSVITYITLSIELYKGMNSFGDSLLFILKQIRSYWVCTFYKRRNLIVVCGLTVWRMEHWNAALRFESGLWHSFYFFKRTFAEEL